ncbi:MAG: hypothetical protein U9N34_01045 [Candidatus Cloacimonadota bacterium]|nr:hypothetical protein [Candidatus Cloacimonadota bacterium]
MDKYSKIAFKIVAILLKIKKGDIVSIAGEIHNLGTEPLSEIALIEELAIAVRKREGFPVLDISTERLKNRYFREIQTKDFQIDYFNNSVDLIDVFVDVGWRSNPEIMNQLSDEEFEQIVEHTEAIWNKIIEFGKKVLFMGFPTKELANYYQLNLKLLQQSFFNGIDCDYSKLVTQTSSFLEKLKKKSKVTINTKANRLICEYEEDKIFLYNGEFRDLPTIILPTGRIAIEVKQISGKFLAEKVYFKTKTFENITIIIENFVISQVDFSVVKTGNNELESYIKSKIKKINIQIGFNKEIQNYTNYLLFDKNILNNVTIQIITEKGMNISLSNKHNKFDIGDE